MYNLAKIQNNPKNVFICNKMKMKVKEILLKIFVHNQIILKWVKVDLDIYFFVMNKDYQAGHN